MKPLLETLQGKSVLRVLSPSAKISQKQAFAIKLSGLITINIGTVVH